MSESRPRTDEIRDAIYYVGRVDPQMLAEYLAELESRVLRLENTQTK